MKSIPARLMFWLFTASLMGCAPDYFNKKIDTMNTEKSLELAQQEFDKNPNNKDAKVQLVNARYRRVNQLFDIASEAMKGGDTELAKSTLQRVLTLDPNNPRALEGLQQIENKHRHDAEVARARQLLETGNIDAARLALRQVLIEEPGHAEARKLIQAIDDKTAKDLITPRKLKPSGTGTISLEFRDANLRNIFEVISKTSGINIVLDPNVRPDLKASIFVRDASVEDVIDFLMLMHQLNKKVLTENSLLIYPSNKAAQYDDMILRSYYLNHADAKQTLSLIKTMLPVRDAFIDEKLNMINVKATYDQLKYIEKLITDEDLPDPEVLLDVEVLEVRRSRLTEIGVVYPDTLSVLSRSSGTTNGNGNGNGSTTNGILTWGDVTHINSDRIGLSPGLAIRLLRQDGLNNLLANPRIRVKNREKARIHIGDKIPILTTTVAANSNFASRSANYLDVGLKLDVEPRVMLNNEVSIRISLEVSNATFTAASEFPTIGTRNTSTVLMTGDGETQVLAGLINDEDRRTIQKVPGLSNIPLIGRLFTRPRDDLAKTEIVLLITPHVVRNLQRPQAANAEFYSGTGTRTVPININPAAVIQQMSGVPPQSPAEPAPAAPAAAPPATPAPNVPPPYMPTPTQPAAPVVPPPGGTVVPSTNLQQLGKPPGSQ